MSWEMFCSNDVENYEIEVTKWVKITQLFLQCCCSCAHGITSNYSALWSRPEQLHMQNMYCICMYMTYMLSAIRM